LIGVESPVFVFPSKPELGDLTLECFELAKQKDKKPAEVAIEIAQKIQANEFIEQAMAVGPYVNFKLKRNVLFQTILEEVISRGENFGKSRIGNGQKVMVEYLSPNTNKPLHLGHLRNGALGMAISNILQASGYQVVKANLVNDRGVHICKSMLAWQKWANGQTPQEVGEKGDHFVGKWYVKYAIEAEKDPRLDQETQAMLKKWEEGDEEILKVWQTMNNWVYDGFEQTYKKFGLQFDVFYYESQTYQLGKEIVQAGVEKGVFQKTEKDSVVFELPIDEFGKDENGQAKKITLIRDDSTSVYLTQDLGTTVLKFKEQGISQCIFVVGSEQNYHFKVLFEILEELGYSWAKDCHHLSYGMVYLPEGKMKSREGKVVDADSLIEQMEKLAKQEITARQKVGLGSDPDPTGSGSDPSPVTKARAGSDPAQKLEEGRALKIALAAIKFYLLRVKAEQDIHFNPKDSLSFDGFTGPYCQYAYARAKSILRTSKFQQLTSNASQLPTTHSDYSLLGNDAEIVLAQKLMAFPEIVKKAAEELNPSKIVVYVYELAKAFNQFYQKHSVLKAESHQLALARLTLVEAASKVIKKALNLLGIDVLEEM